MRRLNKWVLELNGRGVVKADVLGWVVGTG